MHTVIPYLPENITAAVICRGKIASENHPCRKAGRWVQRRPFIRGHVKQFYVQKGFAVGRSGVGVINNIGSILLSMNAIMSTPRFFLISCEKKGSFILHPAFSFFVEKGSLNIF